MSAVEPARVVRLPILGAQSAAAAGADPPLAAPGATLLGRLLDEQQELSAVERFAQRHADADTPLLEPRYRALLPAAPPGPGEQYSFEVDLDRCSGCKACVAACHSLNGLDEGETWRSVGLLVGGSVTQPVQKTVTAACHHCVDPACLRGCPVGAYEKDVTTGIVRHLDDQCIGCQYCVLTCPYEVPQYNAKRGIVRKCDMCAGRLAAGEAPACVQSCPSEAIAIRVVPVARVLEHAQTDAFLPGAPSPALTLPSTTYKTDEVLPRNLLPADFWAVRPSARHLPLVIMLVLTQLATGTLLVERVLAALGFPAPAALAAGLALGTGLFALGASTLHLGRPQYAFRAVLGLRTSWVSREILVFGGFAALASAYALLGWPALGLAAGLAGAAGVFCSVMLYAVTGRAWWSAPRTAFRFFGTTAVLGLAALHLAGHAAGQPLPLAVPLAIAVGVKLAGEAAALVHLRDRRQGDLKRSALLLVTSLRGLFGLRLIAAGIGGLVAPLLAHAVGTGPAAIVWSAVAAVALVAGELCERVIFFAAASAPRMPGVFR